MIKNTKHKIREKMTKSEKLIYKSTKYDIIKTWRVGIKWARGRNALSQ